MPRSNSPQLGSTSPDGRMAIPDGNLHPARFLGECSPLVPDHDDRRPLRVPRAPLLVPQFGLRTLLMLMTACAVLFAASQWLKPIALAALSLLAASIFCHVAGNAMGTRLRELGDRRGRAHQEPACRRMLAQAGHCAPASQLSERRSLGWIVVAAVILGTILGGLSGGLGTLLVFSRGGAEPLAIGVGVLAFGILGGFFAFATAAFAQVLLGAIWQALKPPAKETPNVEIRLPTKINSR